MSQMRLDGTTEIVPSPPLEIWKHDLAKKLPEVQPDELLRMYDVAEICFGSSLKHGNMKERRIFFERREMIRGEIISRMCKAYDSEWDFNPAGLRKWEGGPDTPTNPKERGQ